MMKDFDLDDMLIPIKLDISDLNMICSYVVTTNNQLISRTLLEKTKEFFAKLDKKLYQFDEQLIGRINFITYALKARMDNGIENREILLNHCKNEMHSNIELYEDIVTVIDSKYDNLTTSSVNYISENIINKSRFGFIYSVKNVFMDLFEKIENGEYRNDKEIGEEFEELIRISNNMIKKSRYVENTDTLDLSKGTFENIVGRIVDRLKLPSNKLQTAIQMLNTILAGGFEKSRIYLFLG